MYKAEDTPILEPGAVVLTSLDADHDERKEAEEHGGSPQDSTSPEAPPVGIYMTVTP